MSGCALTERERVDCGPTAWQSGASGARERSARVKSLRTLTNTREQETYRVGFVVGVRGLRVTGDQVFDLGGGVTIGAVTRDIARFEVGEQPWRKATAEMALTARLPKAYDDDATEPAGAARTASREAFDRLDTARYAAAVVLRAPTSVMCTTAYLLESVPGVDADGRTGISGLGLNVPERVIDEHTAAFVSRFHNSIVTLPPELRARVHVAMHRWHSAFLENQPSVDAFIDIGIGLEAIFLADSEGELSFRLSVRAARMLATTKDERVNVARSIGALYRARSQAVHQGRLPTRIPKDVAPDAASLQVTGLAILSRSIQTIVSIGRDDWEEITYS